MIESVKALLFNWTANPTIDYHMYSLGYKYIIVTLLTTVGPESEGYPQLSC